LDIHRSASLTVALSLAAPVSGRRRL
jgi:hypothetical protein